MSARAPRWEIVRGDTGWWARFRASNGRIIAWTETYKRRGNAERAMWIIRDEAIGHYEGRHDVRDVDERSAS